LSKHIREAGMVYIRRTPGAKHDKLKQWNLPDRVFFAAGACHILAYAFLERFPDCDARPYWIKPLDGSPTNHMIILKGDCAFDYHGYTKRDALMSHFQRRACQYWPEWRGELVEIQPDALISTEKSRTYSGLWLREPQDFMFNALPRARAYLDRFSHPDECKAPHGIT
jgi:hypothetical protein